VACDGKLVNSVKWIRIRMEAARHCHGSRLEEQRNMALKFKRTDNSHRTPSKHKYATPE
jgi:hypothetical protein